MKPQVSRPEMPFGTPAVRIIGFLLCTFLASTAFAKGPQKGATQLRLDAVDVTESAKGIFTIYASFIDKYFKPVGVSAKDEWTIFIDGEIADGEFTHKTLRDSDKGVSLVVVIAATASLEDSFEFMKRGASTVLNALRSQDRSVVLAYADITMASSVTTGQAALTPSHNEAISWLDEQKPTGVTPPMLSSLEKALGYFPVDFDTISPNRAILLISDGFDKLDDDQSKRKDLISDLRTAASSRNVRINIVGIAIEDETKMQAMIDLATATGGTHRIALRSAEVEQYLDEVQTEIMGQSVLTFTTNDFEGNKETGFKIDLKHNGAPFHSGTKNRLTEEKDSNLWLYVGIVVGSILGLFILITLVRVLINAMSGSKEEVVYERGPDLTKCVQCGNMVPLEWKNCKYCEALPHYGRLVVTDSDGDEELYDRVFYIKESMTNIGSAATNHIVIPHGTVSKRHAGVRVQDKRFELADYGSTNHTWINGSKINKQFLKDGDTIGLGKIETRFELKS
jgi:hypothetical protein